jgi:predicted dehydrogenase
MNELRYFSCNDPEGEQGFRTILATDPTHAYMQHWWPAGHIIGYEHTFVHAVVDFLNAVDKGKAIEPNFADGLKTIQVLEAGLKSADSGQRVTVLA